MSLHLEMRLIEWVTKIQTQDPSSNLKAVMCVSTLLFGVSPALQVVAWAADPDAVQSTFFIVCPIHTLSRPEQVRQDCHYICSSNQG
jgi:hypothetical protein